MSTAPRLRLRIDDDALAAWLRIETGPALSREELLAFLADEQVAAGLDDAAIDEAVRRLASDDAGGPDSAASDSADAPDSPDAPDEFCIARGRPAVDATPDTIELTEPLGPIVGRLREDGSLDYRERLLIVPVESGGAIGRIVPGSPGAPGFDVRGNTLPCRPAPDLVFPHGDGVAVEPDGRIVAKRSGARSLDKRGRLDIVALHVHPGTVDLASGNLDTAGSLEIKRDVTSGMTVRAGVDLVVRGTVDAARVEAVGAIEIAGGVIGGEGGLVRAGGNLKLGHAQSARIFAGGTLKVARGVLASELHAREIEIAGTLLGDRACAETSLVVREAGSPDGGRCHLVAAQPFDPVGGESPDPAAARDQAKARLRGATLPLAARKARDGRPGRGPRPTEQKATELASKQGFRQRQRELQPIARIVVQGTAHAGCRIDFGGRPLLLEKPVRARSFRFDVESGTVVAGEI